MNFHPVYKLLCVSADGKDDTQDSLSNESFLRLANALRNKIGQVPVPLMLSGNQFVEMVQRVDGSLIRSPDPEFLWQEKFIVSRDQVYMFLLYLFTTQQISAFEKTWDALMKCWPFYFNKDIQGLELLIIRSRQKNWVLRKWLGDLSLVINSFARCGYLPRWKHDLNPDDRVLFNLPRWTRGFWKFVPFDWDDVGDCKLHIATLAVAHFGGSTFLSRFATKFYLKRRPRAEGKKGELVYSYPGTPPMTALRHYYRAETGNSPEIAEAWEPILSALQIFYL